MKSIFKKIVYFLIIGTALSSCVAKKKMTRLQLQYNDLKSDLDKRGVMLNEMTQKFNDCEQQKALLGRTIEGNNDMINSLRTQLSENQKIQVKQIEQVGNLTVLTQKANENIDKTLDQLAKKEQYIAYLQKAKNKADSINLALSANLKGSLNDGLADEDVDVKVDKTVVMINLSDKMLFNSGSYKISPNAYDVLGKIARIIKSRPELEVMVEGYTDNVAIKTSVLDDNWDLSTKRSAAVVRLLQKTFGVDPNKLIAAGRGEFNALVTNDTVEGRSINRRTRIILMPKLDQFYDLLDPDKAK
ncbi:MAG: OmpA family protein [Bacteroidota bacterium]